MKGTFGSLVLLMSLAASGCSSGPSAGTTVDEDVAAVVDAGAELAAQRHPESCVLQVDFVLEVVTGLREEHGYTVPDIFDAVEGVPTPNFDSYIERCGDPDSASAAASAVRSAQLSASAVPPDFDSPRPANSSNVVATIALDENDWLFVDLLSEVGWGEFAGYSPWLDDSIDQAVVEATERARAASAALDQYMAESRNCLRARAGLTSWALQFEENSKYSFEDGVRWASAAAQVYSQSGAFSIAIGSC